MHPHPTEQSVRPRHSRATRHGTVSLATPQRPVFDERAFPHGATPPRSTQPAVHVVSAQGSRRVTTVENVAIHIFSGAIEFAVSEMKGMEGGKGVGQRRWPLMLNRAELCEYLGASWRTLKNTLTVRPVDMGANMIRYNRKQIDTWAASRPALDGGSIDQDTPHPDQRAPVDTTAAALARARERGGKR